ncbi:MAG TPA: energy transducer TonB [Steroidobacteraceae bacterium]|nr:energy transducer TonB [Steroidobacteraceae bacterium]
MDITAHDSQFMTRRTIVLAAIIALHVFIAWALATGLARRAMEVIAPPIQTEIVQEETKKAEPPPPPPPTFEKPPVEVPPPEVTIDLPQETSQTTAITAVVTKAPVAVAKAAVAAAAAHILLKGFPNSDDYYPPASKRLGEEGSPVVHVCVNAQGKLTAGTPSIKQTSGSSRLDDGAINLAKAGQGHYAPGTGTDGKPVDESCFDFKVKFQLR